MTEQERREAIEEFLAFAAVEGRVLCRFRRREHWCQERYVALGEQEQQTLITDHILRRPR